MFEVYATTHIGRVRLHNEDGFLVNRVIAGAGTYTLHTKTLPLIVAVADGMGGERAGEVASRVVLTELSSLDPAECQEHLKEALDRINRSVVRYGAEHPEARGLGTTLSGVIVDDHQSIVFHVGDSRVYRFRDGFLKRLTTDHSWVQTLYKTGQISEAEGISHPMRHVLMQYLGMENSEQFSPDVFTVNGHLGDGDMFVLCSDGLCAVVSDDDIEAELNEAKPLAESVQALIQKALDEGGPDNITVVVVKKV